MEAEKPNEPERARPKTAAVNRTDNWGLPTVGGEDDDLEDLPGDGDASGQTSAREQALMQKKRTLFGAGSRAPGGASDASKRSKSLRPTTQDGAAGLSGSNEGMQLLAAADASVGSQGSGIETLDLPNSRARRRMVGQRPPTAGTANRPSDISQQSRPPTGPALNQI